MIAGVEPLGEPGRAHRHPRAQRGRQVHAHEAHLGRAAAAPSGERVASPDLIVGNFAQLEVDRLDSRDTALVALTRTASTRSACASQWDEQRRRNHLGGFGFRGDRVFEPVVHFSGGERARLALAILVAERPNLLLLDEPTNHLDFEMRHSLITALQDFAGAVIVVSHDRGLLRSVCDQFWLVSAIR